MCVRQVRALALRLLSECDGHVGRALNRVRTQLAQGVASSVPGAAAAAVPAEKAADADADTGAGEDADTEAEAPPRSPARSSSPDEEEWVAREQAVHLAHMEQAAALRAAAEQAAEQAAVLQAVAERGLASCGASCLHTPGSRPGSRPGSARPSSARLSSPSQSSASRSGDAVAGRDPEAEVALLYSDMEVELDEAEAAARMQRGGKKWSPVVYGYEGTGSATGTPTAAIMPGWSDCDPARVHGGSSGGSSGSSHASSSSSSSSSSTH